MYVCTCEKYVYTPSINNCTFMPISTTALKDTYIYKYFFFYYYSLYINNKFCISSVFFSCLKFMKFCELNKSIVEKYKQTCLNKTRSFTVVVKRF